jgi:hypothetical protein
LVTTGAAAPGGGVFQSFDSANPVASNGKVAFVGSVSAYYDGIFLNSGGVTSRIVGTGDTVSGHAAALTGFFTTNRVGNDDGNLGLVAASAAGKVVIGYSAGGGLLAIADTATPAPGTSSNFTGFGIAPAVDGSRMYFFGTHAGGDGIYATDVGGGLITTIADTGTAVPGIGGNFTGFSEFVAADNGRVVFLGDYTGGRGLFVQTTNTFLQVVGVGDTLDGRTVTGISFNLDSVRDDQLMFVVAFSGGATAIYQTSFATIPEPATYAALAATLIFGVTLLRRRKDGRGAVIY